MILPIIPLLLIGVGKALFDYFYNPNTTKYCYDDFFSSTIIEYDIDDTDKWTLQDLRDDNDPNDTDNLIKGKTTEE